MKLSPEAKQAIKTAIEQLRLLLVDDAISNREEKRPDEEAQICIMKNCYINGKIQSNKLE